MPLSVADNCRAVRARQRLARTPQLGACAASLQPRRCPEGARESACAILLTCLHPLGGPAAAHAPKFWSAPISSLLRPASLSSLAYVVVRTGHMMHSRFERMPYRLRAPTAPQALRPSPFAALCTGACRLRQVAEPAHALFLRRDALLHRLPCAPLVPFLLELPTLNALAVPASALLRLPLSSRDLQ